MLHTNKPLQSVLPRDAGSAKNVHAGVGTKSVQTLVPKLALLRVMRGTCINLHDFEGLATSRSPNATDPALRNTGTADERVLILRECF